MKDGKVTVIDGIPSELLKNLSKNMHKLHLLYDILVTCYKTGDIPGEFFEILVNIKKEQLLFISILLHVSKILLVILIDKIKNKIEQIVREDFRSEKETTKTIFSLFLSDLKASSIRYYRIGVLL